MDRVSTWDNILQMASISKSYTSNNQRLIAKMFYKQVEMAGPRFADMRDTIDFMLLQQQANHIEDPSGKLVSATG